MAIGRVPRREVAPGHSRPIRLGLLPGAFAFFNRLQRCHPLLMSFAKLRPHVPYPEFVVLHCPLALDLVDLCAHPLGTVERA